MCIAKPSKFRKTIPVICSPHLPSAAVLAMPVIAMADTALIETPLGDIEIELLTDDAPNTVANFLNYVAELQVLQVLYSPQRCQDL